MRTKSLAGFLAAAALALGLAACGGTGFGGATPPAPSGTGSDANARAAAPATASKAAPATASRAAPSSAALTLLDGKSATLAAFRGRPLLVWFVADGCASCAVSIPAVARHFRAFNQTGTRILVLGMYGAFGSGAAGRTQLASFGRSAAGPAFNNPTWTWALASARLNIAYDPSGVPDAYFLLNADGRLIYQNSVPVSTMGALLAHLRQARA